MCSTSDGLHDDSGKLRNVAAHPQPSPPNLRSKRYLERIVVALAGSRLLLLISPAEGNNDGVEHVDVGLVQHCYSCRESDWTNGKQQKPG
jgi:hypothetical protein